MGINFYKDTICLNCLTQSIENAKEIYEAMEGHVLLGLLSSDYNNVEEAIKDMMIYKEKFDNNISVGLGQGNPDYYQRVIDISEKVKPNHINQVFTAVGLTRSKVGENSFINALIKPSDDVDKVIISTGSLSSKSEKQALVDLETAILMAKEMGANSIKYFPMKGLKYKKQLIKLSKLCAEADFALEPTGGIDLDNFEEIITIIYKEGVKKIIPHVYSSIIDKETKLTKIEDVKKIYEIIKRVIK